MSRGLVVSRCTRLPAVDRKNCGFRRLKLGACAGLLVAVPHTSPSRHAVSRVHCSACSIPSDRSRWTCAVRQPTRRSAARPLCSFTPKSSRPGPRFVAARSSVEPSELGSEYGFSMRARWPCVDLWASVYTCSDGHLDAQRVAAGRAAGRATAHRASHGSPREDGKRPGQAPSFAGASMSEPSRRS